MELNAVVEEYVRDIVQPEALSMPLPDPLAGEVVERLKQEADRHWHINPNYSLAFAECIMAIGRARNDASQIALGLMARGDALNFLNQTEAAWNALGEAGSMFQAAGDEVGWARTRIGRLALGMKLNRVAEARADAEIARVIFISHGEDEKLLRLNLQMGFVHNYLGQYLEALQLFQVALDIAHRLGGLGQKYFGQLYVNIGFGYDALGDFRRAVEYYELARPYMVAAAETGNIAILNINIGYIAQARGHYRRALKLLHQVLIDVSDNLPEEAMWAKCDMVECYLHLNRYVEARDLASQVIADYRNENNYARARTLLHLAAAEAQLSNFAGAEAALEESRKIFESQGASQWVVTTHLWQGKMALKQGDAATAYREALTAAEGFESGGQRVGLANAYLLQAQALFALQEFDNASVTGIRSLRVAQQDAIPSLRYSSHVLLAQIKETRGAIRRAMRHYQAAAATVERVQRGLSITLRPGFLEDKGEALRSLIALHLRTDQPALAFEALERAKSHVWLGYLANQEDLHWAPEDIHTRSLIEELTRLRDEHQWFYRLANDPPRGDDHPSAISPAQARTEVAIRERKMRAITEQIYLQRASEQQGNPMRTPSLVDIQQTLHRDALLIEFYNDGTHLWAFLLDREGIRSCRLPIQLDALHLLLGQLQSNIAAALRIRPQISASNNLTLLSQRILQRLHALLIEPLGLHERKVQRLIIVPYGLLHYLPFHLLHDGSAYLIENYEIAILPAAGLSTRPPLHRNPGALVMAHSWDGRLPHTLVEAQMVQELFHGVLYVEDAATRTNLRLAPSQILHIAAHGQHRLDQPDLSYLQLGDGQLYTDDLLQENLSYELVTLSGCETGRANVAPGDELIGLGRGFLYAGAGALLVSLWPVVDDTTTQFMEGMYKALRSGLPKTAALRKAQREILNQNRELHPAFWGAFQLIGDARPLSM
jgi:CHAT domain-containing protein